jgi:hypothetical protein
MSGANRNKRPDIKLPPLEVGRTYRAVEVAAHVAEDDLEIAILGFPRDLARWPHADMLSYRPDEEVLFDYDIWDISLIRPQVEDLRVTFKGVPEQWERVSRIMGRFERGEAAYPIFVQLNDPERRICEGMHRAVAMLELGVSRVPVLQAKYGDWKATAQP